MSHIVIVLALAALLNACASPDNADPSANQAVKPDIPVSSDDRNMQPPQHDFRPKPSDVRLRRGNAMLDTGVNNIEVLESFPPQFVLILKGSLPTPCHQLRLVVNPPDKHHNIHIDAYSVADPGKICIQVLQSFDIRVPLGSFPAGHYRVFANGGKQGEFDA